MGNVNTTFNHDTEAIIQSQYFMHQGQNCFNACNLSTTHIQITFSKTLLQWLKMTFKSCLSLIIYLSETIFFSLCKINTLNTNLKSKIKVVTSHYIILKDNLILKNKKYNNFSYTKRPHTYIWYSYHIHLFTYLNKKYEYMIMHLSPWQFLHLTHYRQKSLEIQPQNQHQFHYYPRKFINPFTKTRHKKTRTHHDRMNESLFSP